MKESSQKECFRRVPTLSEVFRSCIIIMVQYSSFYSIDEAVHTFFPTQLVNYNTVL